MSGYVRLHRTLAEGHPAFRNDAEAMAFAWMIAKAQWKPARVRYKERGIYLDRGQLAVSQRDMARALDRDKAWIERLWKRLRAEAMIEVACEAGVAVITICNYAKYQASSDEGEAVNEAYRKAEARQTQGTEQEREEGKKEDTEAKASSARVLAHYREMAKANSLPDIRILNSSRKQSLRLRIREIGEDAMHEAIDRIPRSKFLTGQTDRHFRADFDFLLQPKSLTRILEGFYEDDSEKPKRVLTPEARRRNLEDLIPFYEKIGRKDDADECRRKLASIGTIANDIVRRAAQ